MIVPRIPITGVPSVRIQFMPDIADGCIITLSWVWIDLLTCAKYITGLFDTQH